MADKRATVFIVDLGQSMGECHNGRIESDLDYGMRYVWDKVAKIMVTDKKDWKVGFIGVRTDETANPLSNDGEYENISVLKEIDQMKMDDFDDLKSKIQPSETEAGDAISAIVVAIHLIEKATTLKSKALGKYARKIVLLTNGQGSIEDDGILAIAEKINEIGIELVVVGVDFDDPEFGFKEEDKSSIKKNTETVLEVLVDSCKAGMFGTAALAIKSGSDPSPKQVRPYAPYKGRLSLGDFEKYPRTALYIDVERYSKTKQARAVSARSFVTRTSLGVGAQYSGILKTDIEMSDAPEMSAVNSTIFYEVDDPASIGGKKQLLREDLAKGYEYGSTVVPMEEANENTTNFESFKSFSIIGFIPSDKYERHLAMGESCVTIAQTGNDKARIAFSSLVHALHELDSYAVARIVLKDGKGPRILLLAPSIEPDLEAFYDVPLPFQEDVRNHRFPPLDRVLNTSGAPIPNHRNLPTEEQEEAMSKYIDKMDLSNFGTDDDGNPTEYMTIEETFNPYIHRVTDAICQRAMYPDEELAPPAEILTKWSNPPSKLVSKAMPELQRLVNVMNVKPVPPRAKGKRGKDAIVPLSGLDVDALLSKKPKISRDNAIPEFKQMLKTTTDDKVLEDAAKQMGNLIREQISDSTGSSWYDQAIANMRVFRREMVEYELPDLYNSFILDLKDKLNKSHLGDRRDFWFIWKGSKLGLIDDQTLENSEVTEEEALSFFRLDTAQLPTRGR